MKATVAAFRLAGLVACAMIALLGATGAASTTRSAPRVTADNAVPGIDPAFIYTQLDYLATHFQHREAGYRAGSAGHAGFARYWTHEMASLLGSYGASVRSYPFHVAGWLGRRSTAPAVNVEVTVPGMTDPAHEVIIGCHYDGEADSTQSAYDDASGCAIELGVAKAMAAYWTSRHLYPARTLRFVIFDAEEQGLYGSFDYVNHVARGDLQNMTLMINEEQNGVGYPVHYLGLAANPVLPFFAYLSPFAKNAFYSNYSISSRERAAIVQLRQLVRRAAAASFERFRQMGDQLLTYWNRSGGTVWRPIFTAGQLASVQVQSDAFGSSDQVPFTAAGVRAAMFVANATYYDRGAPAGSYPYDQPQDTIALLNTFADGGLGPSHALELALGLPGMLSTWLLSQPSVLGQVPGDGRPVAALSDIGLVTPGRPVTFAVGAAYDPAQPAAALRYRWSFGDGGSASGASVGHTYHAPGRYRLQLTVSGGGRSRVITRSVIVGKLSNVLNPYAAAPSPTSPLAASAARGVPLPNHAVVLPVANPGLRDQVATTARAGRRSAPTTGSGSAGIWAWVGAGVIVLLSIGFWAFRARRSRRAPS